MTKYQLKLAKLYAELIGIDALVHRGGLLYPNDQGYMFENGVTCDWFNPFIGQLQLDARDNFGVEVDYIGDCQRKLVSIFHHAKQSVEYGSNSDISTAVIECILKSKGAL